MSEVGVTTVELEGLIGCGKTTSCTALAKKYPDAFYVVMEVINRMLLGEFYPEQKQWAFALQWGQLQRRLGQAREVDVQKKLRKPEFVMWDRGLIGDAAFAYWNMLTGNISLKGVQIYENELGGSFNDLKTVKYVTNPDFLVFVDAEPAICRKRLEKERCNEEELNIEFNYYRGLDCVHFCLMLQLVLQKIRPVHLYSTPGTDDPDRAHCFLRDMRDGKIAPIWLDRHDPPPQNGHAYCRIYKTVHGVLDAYNKCIDHEKNVFNFPKELVDVYIPLNLGEDLEAMETLQYLDLYPELRIYTNPFIRLTMAHLRAGHHVHLYTAKKL